MKLLNSILERCLELRYTKFLTIYILWETDFTCSWKRSLPSTVIPRYLTVTHSVLNHSPSKKKLSNAHKSIIYTSMKGGGHVDLNEYKMSHNKTKMRIRAPFLHSVVILSADLPLEMMLLLYPLPLLVFQTSLIFDMTLPVVVIQRCCFFYASQSWSKMLQKSKLSKTLLFHTIPMAIMTTTLGSHRRTYKALASGSFLSLDFFCAIPFFSF